VALLWSGRFREPPSETLRRFNDSFVFDAELLAEDVRGSQAWARALGRAGVLRKREVGRLVKALAEVAAEPLPADRAAYEDVHSYVEARLGEKLGDLAGKLHTGRSRNDQVATDFKLYVRDALQEARQRVLGVCEVLASRALPEAGTAMPGYTHMKRAEPVTFGHWCLAYVEMLLRDVDRLGEAWERAGECPLGSGALSGTPVAIDRERLAGELGFAAPTACSLDGVSDRDFAADYLYASALLLVHLSRMSEDLIAFTSDELAFAELPDALATGSSRMPHKKNPDVPELVRGHAGRAIGELTGLLSLLKGLPLAYDKDLQLDKEPVFRTRRTLALALPALRDLLAGLALHRDRMAAAAADPRLLATALADAMAARGVPFREAHEIVGRRVAEAESAGRTLFELGPSEEIREADLEAVELGRVLARRSATGGTSPARVAAAAKAARKRIEARAKPRRKA
jgi:argininosuccinate lyase/amino-acid N-acetyltransferase